MGKKTSNYDKNTYRALPRTMSKRAIIKVSITILPSKSHLTIPKEHPYKIYGHKKNGTIDMMIPPVGRLTTVVCINQG